jgi:hypothetical protein
MTAAELLASCNALVLAEELFPEYGPDGRLQKTFCNIGARRIAHFAGCVELDDMSLNADAMAELMAKNSSSRWSHVAAGAAVEHACNGGLAFAIMTGHALGEAHGHIATVRPEPMQESASAGGLVPMLANVGPGCPKIALRPMGRGDLLTRPNWSCRASEAFPYKRVGPATYFAWRP